MKKLVWLFTALFMLAAFCLAEGTAVKVAENDRLSLYVNEDIGGITVEDRLTGYVWSSSLNDETFDSSRVNAMWKKKLSSMIMLNYTNLNQGLGSINNMALLGDKQYSGSYTPIENGVLLHYVFGSCSIEVDVKVELDTDSMLVSIPYDSIRETGIYSVVSIDMMPFFCGAADFSDGYFVYPDGCGALMEFSDIAHMNEKTKLYSVYGNLEKNDVLLEMLDQPDPKVMLPAYGMNRNGGGVLCAIENGAETARISVNCSNNIIKASYLFTNFMYRRAFDDKRVTDRSFKIYDKQAIKTDYSLRVFFLDPGENDYSGMARRYRRYLTEEKGISEKETEPYVALDFFMTAEEEGLLIDTPRTVTTFDQAADILQRLSEKGVTDLLVTVKGWSREGYGKKPDSFPVNSSAGGLSGLKKLAGAAESTGARLLLMSDFIVADEESSGYSERTDVAYTGNWAILTNHDEDTFLLSPDKIREKYDEFMKEAAGSGIDGICFESLGNTLVYNYYSKRTFTAKETLEIYSAMLKDTKTRLGFVSVEGGSLYAAAEADLVTNVPLCDMDYQFTTRSIPFYQLVMHGITDYTATPGNLTSDVDREILRWIEFGCVPSFELTAETTESLMYTKYPSLFSAKEEMWTDKLCEVYSMFTTGDLAEIHSRQMLTHEILTEDVRRVTYASGYTVYVNYGSGDYTDGAIAVAAGSYTIIREG